MNWYIGLKNFQDLLILNKSSHDQDLKPLDDSNHTDLPVVRYRRVTDKYFVSLIIPVDGIIVSIQ